MADLISSERFLLLRVAAEQRRAAESMRGLVSAVERFITVVDQACSEAKDELEAALARTAELQRAGAAERSRSLAALDHGGLEEMIAGRDRLLALRGDGAVR